MTQELAERIKQVLTHDDPRDPTEELEIIRELIAIVEKQHEALENIEICVWADTFLGKDNGALNKLDTIDVLVDGCLPLSAPLVGLKVGV